MSVVSATMQSSGGLPPVDLLADLAAAHAWFEGALPAVLPALAGAVDALERACAWAGRSPAEDDAEFAEQLAERYDATGADRVGQALAEVAAVLGSRNRQSVRVEMR